MFHTRPRGRPRKDSKWSSTLGTYVQSGPEKTTNNKIRIPRNQNFVIKTAPPPPPVTSNSCTKSTGNVVEQEDIHTTHSSIESVNTKSKSLARAEQIQPYTSIPVDYIDEEENIRRVGESIQTKRKLVPMMWEKGKKSQVIISKVTGPSVIHGLEEGEEEIVYEYRS